MRDQLTVISDNSHNLTTLTAELQRGLNRTIDNLTRIQNNCTDLSLLFCNDINTDGLETQADFTNLPNVSSELSNIEKVIDRDFEKAVEDVSCYQKLCNFSSQYSYLSEMILSWCTAKFSELTLKELYGCW